MHRFSKSATELRTQKPKCLNDHNVVKDDSLGEGEAVEDTDDVDDNDGKDVTEDDDNLGDDDNAYWAKSTPQAEASWSIRPS